MLDPAFILFLSHLHIFNRHFFPDRVIRLIDIHCAPSFLCLPCLFIITFFFFNILQKYFCIRLHKRMMYEGWGLKNREFLVKCTHGYYINDGKGSNVFRGILGFLLLILLLFFDSTVSFFGSYCGLLFHSSRVFC